MVFSYTCGASDGRGRLGLQPMSMSICLCAHTPHALRLPTHPHIRFKKDLEDRQRRLIRFENVQELMKQYKKPL